MSGNRLKLFFEKKLCVLFTYFFCSEFLNLNKLYDTPYTTTLGSYYAIFIFEVHYWSPTLSPFSDSKYQLKLLLD